MTDKDTVLSLEQTLRLALEALTVLLDEWTPARQAQLKGMEAVTAIKAALEAKDEPVAHSVVAGALFDFMGWLTSREKRLILSSVDEASPAVEAITEFAKKRNLSLKYAEVGYWMEFLSTPPPVADPHKRPSRSDIKPLTDEEIGAILEGVNAYGTRLYTFARAIEAAHGIIDPTDLKGKHDA